MPTLSTAQDKELAGLSEQASQQLASKNIIVSPDVILSQWLQEDTYPNLGGVQLTAANSTEGMQNYVNTLAADLKSGNYSANNVADFVSKLEASNYCTDACGSFYAPASDKFTSTWNSLLGEARLILQGSGVAFTPTSVSAVSAFTPSSTSGGGSDIPSNLAGGGGWGAIGIVTNPSNTTQGITKTYNKMPSTDWATLLSNFTSSLGNIGVVVLGGIAIIGGIFLLVWQSPAGVVKNAIGGKE